MRHVKIEDPSSDQALMAAFVARDERAAGALYDRFASRVYGLGIVMSETLNGDRSKGSNGVYRRPMRGQLIRGG